MEKIALFGEKKHLISYFGPLREQKGFEGIDLIFLEELENKEDLVGILLQYPQNDLSFVQKKDLKIPLIIVFDSKNISESDIKNLEELCHRDERIKGIIDTQKSLNFHLPILRGLISKIDTHKILGDFLGRSLIQLERIKDMHKKIVPLRSGRSNGINYFSKFASGESPGGEFFNFLNKNLENMFFYTNASSYMISNLILSAYEKFKFENFDLKEFEDFINNLLFDKINFEKDRFEILIARIDRKNLKMEGYNFSTSKFFLKKELEMPSAQIKELPPSNLADSHFSFNIGRGERLYIFSSGFIANMEKYYPEFKLENLVEGSYKKTAGDALNEFFFKLKRKMEGKFPFYDSSVTIIEVDENVLFQI